MIRVIASICLVFAVDFSVDAAPNRMPHGPMTPPEAPAIALNALAKDGILAFGNWVVGQTSHENGILLIHKDTRMGIYLPWASNGWINYRGVDGTGYVHWSQGGSDPQMRDYELDRLFAKAPTGRVAPGKYVFQAWTVTVSDDAMEFHCSSMGCKLSIRRDASAFTHNAQTISGGPVMRQK